jgi:hypothetical protein
MLLDRPDTDFQGVGDLGIRFGLGEMLEYSELAASQQTHIELAVCDLMAVDRPECWFALRNEVHRCEQICGRERSGETFSSRCEYLRPIGARGLMRKNEEACRRGDPFELFEFGRFVEDHNVRCRPSEDILQVGAPQTTRQDANAAIRAQYRCETKVRQRIEAADRDRNLGLGCVERSFGGVLDRAGKWFDPTTAHWIDPTLG